MPLRSSVLLRSGLALVLALCAARASAAPMAEPPSTSASAATASPSSPHKGPRLAVDVFKVDGDGVPPALVLQLLDGFVLGLVRQGLQVVDPDDVKKRLATAPELAGCDSSPCLKRIGQMLQAGFVARVKVDVVGNSYKMLVRVYRTEGAAPAALPVDTRSRFCDVCTIAEARDVMIKLADGIDLPRDEVATKALPPPPPPPQPSRLAPALTIGAGIAAIVGGAIALATSARDDKTVHALSGALMGAGAAGTTLGIYLLLDRAAPRPAMAGVGLGATF